MTIRPHSDRIDPPPRLALSASTLKRYRSAFLAFERWCAEQGTSALPASLVSIADYLQYLSDRKIRAATIQVCHAAILDTHLRAGHQVADEHRHVRNTLDSLVESDTRPQVPAMPLTSQDLAAIRHTACTPRKTSGRMPREESESAAKARVLLDIALVAVMRDGLLRRSEAAALRWGDLTQWSDGAGRLSLTGVRGSASIVFIGREAVTDLVAIRPEGAGFDDGIFGLSPSHIGKRVREAAVAADLGDGYTGDSCRVGMAKDLDGKLPGRTSRLQERFQSHEAAGQGRVAKYYRMLLETRGEQIPTQPASP